MPRPAHESKIQIEPVVSSSSGERFQALEAPKYHQLLEDDRLFDYCQYAREVHAPVALFDVATTALYDDFERCLDMPIRIAGDHEYAVPENWKTLVPLIQDIVSIEQANNPNWKQYHTYITIDSSSVDAYVQQRHGGLHVDGFQGERIDPKTKITRNYVVSTNGGTRFYPQRFVVADPKVFNVFQGFDIQAETERSITAEEGVVHFMNAYTVHESGFASRKGIRTFLRVTFDLKKFDREGNTQNKMLDYDWQMVERATQDDVRTPDFLDLERSPFF